MGPARLLLASIVAMSIFLHMLLVHGANSEEVFPEADGPAAESSEELWLRSGPPARVVDVDDYGAGDADDDDDDTEVNPTFSLLVGLGPALLSDCSVTQPSCSATGRSVYPGCSSDRCCCTAPVSGVSRGVDGGLQLLRLLVRVPRARGQVLPPDARGLPWPLQSCLGHCNGEPAAAAAR